MKIVKFMLINTLSRLFLNLVLEFVEVKKGNKFMGLTRRMNLEMMSI